MGVINCPLPEEACQLKRPAVKFRPMMERYAERHQVLHEPRCDINAELSVCNSAVESVGDLEGHEMRSCQP